MLLLGDSLVGYGWGDGLVNGSVMVASLVHEALNCLLGGFHGEVLVSGSIVDSVLVVGAGS